MRRKFYFFVCTNIVRDYTGFSLIYLKTSTQNLELFVGFDTDWIGIGKTWRDYGFILRRRIPIVTNQPEIFIGSGLKIFGIVRSKIRCGTDGKPSDIQSRLMTWPKAHDRNVRE